MVKVSISRVMTAILLFCLITAYLPFTCFAGSLDPKDPPFKLPPLSELKKLRSALIETNRGDIRLELFPEDAPWHVANLKYLADRGYFRNKLFHIAEPDYIVQGGVSSLRTPNQSPGYSIPPEFTERKHEEGSFGMARLIDSVNPERRSNAGQFYITLNDARRMNGRYTIVGQVSSGIDVARRLKVGDRILDLTVYVRP